MTAGDPAVFVLDRRSRLHTGPAGGLLVGGQPLRVLRLAPNAQDAVTGWRAGAPVPVGPPWRLARRLHDLGLGVLRAPTTLSPADVTVVVPVRDRPTDLARCLASLGAARVLVVDDGSRDPAAIAAVAARHGAQLLVRPVNGGPAAARNTGLARAETDLVAFVDSDCVVPPHWLDGLLTGLLDERVAVVAPRVVGAGGPGRLARYEVRHGPLDLGAEAAPVRAGGRVGHVPAAVLLCRRDALGVGFDEALRVGEDVDLIWRLVERGLQVRYEPDVVVAHRTRGSWRAAARQRHGYGRSAALLDHRHPGRVAPAVLGPWAAPALLALALRRPGVAVAVTVGSAVLLRRRLPAGPGRTLEAVRLAGSGPVRSAAGLLDCAARAWLPVLLPLAVVDRRARRLTALAVCLRLLRTGGHPLRVLDDLAYATGVWRGAAEHRRPGVVLPRWRAVTPAGA